MTRVLTQSGVLLMLSLALLNTASTAIAAPSAERWSFWEPSDEASERIVDHGAWQALLDCRVETLADDRTIIHYGDFTPDDRAKLTGYLTTITALDPRTLNRREQFAYWINLYNALTVDLMLNNLEKESILRVGGGFLPTGPWDDRITRVANQWLTLNDIEHRILRPIFKDQRIHYAVNCASIGCPNLSPTAYTSENLETLLDEGERLYLNHPRGLALVDGKLTLSSIFKWYRGDFGASEEALLAYLASVRTDLADELSGYDRRIRYAYGWERNDH
ncbi:MAG: DUF547 domain-containing protein [Pseudomonadota bacterium]